MKANFSFDANMIRFLLTISFLALISCGVGGGGGGGDSFDGAAHVSLDIDPNEIDAGDQLTATVDIHDVHEDGIMLKIRVPSGLSYIVDSTTLEVSDRIYDWDPTTRKSDSKYNYVIYFLDRDIFGDDDYGRLSVKFLGTSAVDDGKIEIDPDINNRQVTDTREFDVSDPRFSAEAEEGVTVRN